MTTDNKLVKTGKLGPLRVGLAARLDQAKKDGAIAHELFDCTKYPNRIVLVIDDSGSMGSTMVTKKEFCKACGDSGYILGAYGESEVRCPHCPTDKTTSRMETCRKACEEFLNVCDTRDTALGLYTISTGQEFNLSIAYPMLLAEIRKLVETGGTPTISTLDKVITKEKVTRVVLVSDGESGATSTYPANSYNEYRIEQPQLTPTALATLNKYKEAKISIDTVFIGSQGDESSSGHTEMKLIAEYTGGIFMFFKEGESFRTKFKYLAPVFYKALASGEIKI